MAPAATGERTRILFVITGVQFGGGERVFAQIINGLPEDEYEVFLASHQNEQFYDAIQRKNVHLFPLNFARTMNLPLIWKLAAIMRENRIQIVNGQGTRAGFYARLAARFAGRVPYVSSTAALVDVFNVHPLKKALYRFLDHVSERYVHLFLAVSDAVRKLLIEQHHIPEQKVVRVYNGIELELYQPGGCREDIRKSLGIGAETPVVASIGRLVWAKGLEYLIACAPDILKAFPKTKFVLAGDGPLRADLEALTDKHGVKEAFLFTGFHPDIREILSAADIVATPSRTEGFPMVTLEAMAMAKPIVASTVGGIPEQITNGETGLLVPPHDSRALGEAIISLLGDPDAAQRMGESARQYAAQHFSVDEMLRLTMENYRTLLADTGSVIS